MAFMTKTLLFLTLAFSADAYWLMGAENVLVTERLDPIVSPGGVSSHVHTIFGGSNFGTLSTAALRQSGCTSVPIAEDKSNYWVPQLYFQHKNGSFTDVHGGAVIYYLFSNPAGNITAFPDDFRMISGTPTLRTYNPTSYAQQAITFLCLDFNGVTTRHNELPTQQCPSGVRAQLNFPSCWDGKNVDSADHKSHVAFRSGGPDSGSCTDPKYPVELPRIFMELYWSTGDFSALTNDAMNPTQPFVFSSGDSTGYGYHGDYINGWDAGVLQRAINNCNCNNFGDPTCCAQQHIFTLKPSGQQCSITPTVNEQVLGTLNILPGNNPVVGYGATPASPPAQVNVPSGKPGASPSPDIPPAKGTSAPSPSVPPPPPAYIAPGKGQAPPAPSGPSNATVPKPSPSLNKPSPPPAGNHPYPSPSGCESAKVVTVTVTVMADPTPIPSPSPTDDDCDEETPSPTHQHPATSTPKTKASRSIRARHNAGRRFLHNNGRSFQGKEF
ncbi:protein of unknown function (DUF1996) domain containing protein [Amanita muscaria]